jgi:long-chain acyl-CoA synthetase
MDEDNLFVFTGRSSDMIMSGGENVMAGRVEGVIREHPAVDEVAVFGLPHERWGEAVTAAVVLHPDEDLTEDDILEYCRSEQSPLAGYEIPKGAIFLEELPMTVGEKKQKFKLENQYEDYYR